MILVGQYDSPYVRRVAVSLHLLGIPFERAPLSTFRDLDKMRRVNPTLRVPALILDDGETLTDSHAILDWLDGEVGPDRALMPRGGRERRRCWQAVGLADTACDKAKDMLYERALRPAAKVHEPVVERYRAQLEAALQGLEAMARQPWMLGETISQADIAVACMWGFVRSVAPEVAQARHWSLLGVVSDRCETLAAFRSSAPSPDERLAGG